MTFFTFVPLKTKKTELNTLSKIDVADDVNAPMELLLIVLNAIVLEQGFISDEKWYWLLLITIPLLLIALFF